MDTAATNPRTAYSLTVFFTSNTMVFTLGALKEKQKKKEAGYLHRAHRLMAAYLHLDAYL